MLSYTLLAVDFQLMPSLPFLEDLFEILVTADDVMADALRVYLPAHQAKVKSDIQDPSNYQDPPTALQ